MPNEEYWSQRFFQISIDAARPELGIQKSGMAAEAETGVRPRSATTRGAAARLSVFKNSSSSLSVNSTFLIPARAQPSSDLRYPAFSDVFWCRDSTILLGAAGAGVTAAANGARSTVLRESMGYTISPFTTRWRTSERCHSITADGRL